MKEEAKNGSVHTTVLLNETIEGLNLDRNNKKGGVIVDATFGGGGHSKNILEKYPEVRIIALDQDKGAFNKAKDKFKNTKKRITFVNINFRDIDEAVKKEGEDKVDGIIFDLGLSRDQLENSGRGFSFMKDEPLLMTMKENPRPEDLTALEIVNDWGEKSLADIIYGYGEERFSRKIASAIVEARKKKKIQTTMDLAKIIESSVPSSYKRGKINPATKTFQALRITVNDELGALEAGIRKGFNILKKGGRMSVISFHSLEDRIVKKFFREKEKEGEVRLINKKPIIPKEEELNENRRSRSAKLRILEKLI